MNAGEYRKGYEDYGRLVQRLCDVQHQSCLVLTSRERLKEVARLTGEQSLVRTYQVAGLTQEESVPLLSNKGLQGYDHLKKRLIEVYAGNPLALQLVAQCIQDVFAGDIAAFFQEGEVVFHDIQEVLDQQWHRLTSLEQTVLYWLAIEREAVSRQQISERLVPSVSRKALQDTLE